MASKANPQAQRSNVKNPNNSKYVTDRANRIQQGHAHVPPPPPTTAPPQATPSECAYRPRQCSVPRFRVDRRARRRIRSLHVESEARVGLDRAGRPDRRRGRRRHAARHRAIPAARQLLMRRSVGLHDSSVLRESSITGSSCACARDERGEWNVGRSDQVIVPATRP